MPARPYSSVILDLAGENYLATARVTASNPPMKPNGTALGTFTLFNLAGQRLGANTTLALQEASFPFLHVDLELAGVAGLAPPPPSPSRAPKSPPAARPRPSTLPSPLPPSSASAAASLSPPSTFPPTSPSSASPSPSAPAGTVNFSRTVVLRARPHPAHPDPENPQPAVETLTGEISRVRLTEAGKEIRQQTLSIPATLGANAQDDAEVEVAIQNGDDRPSSLSLRSARNARAQTLLRRPGPLEPLSPAHPLLRQPPGRSPHLRLRPPLRPRQPRPAPPPSPPKPSTPPSPPTSNANPSPSATPELLWVALLAMVSILGIVAFRSAKKI